MEAKQRRTQLRGDVEAEFGSFDLSPLQLVGETLPTPTELIERLAGAGVMNASGSAPTTTSARQRITRRCSQRYFDWTDPTAGATISPDLLDRLIVPRWFPTLRSLQYLCAYLGWPTEPLDAYFDRVNCVIPASSDPQQ